MIKNALVSTAILTGAFFTPAASEQDIWSYEGATGPNYWGSLSNEYAACQAGAHQSPINLEGTDPAVLHTLHLNYNVTPIALRHTGKQITQTYMPGSFLKVGVNDFELKSFTFHTPSEHTISGGRFPLEIQFKHEDKSGKTAILSVFGSYGDENQAASEIIQNLPLEAGQNTKLAKTLINARDLTPHNKAYYRYNGSLTQPPCTEGVSWYILKTPITFSKEQINLLTSLTGENARPVHDRNHRIILDTDQ